MLEGAASAEFSLRALAVWRLSDRVRRRSAGEVAQSREPLGQAVEFTGESVAASG